MRRALFLHPEDERLLVKVKREIFKSLGEDAEETLPLYAILPSFFSSMESNEIKDAVSSVFLAPPSFCGNEIFFPIHIKTRQNEADSKIVFAKVSPFSPSFHLESAGFQGFPLRRFRLCLLKREGFALYVSSCCWVKIKNSSAL